MRHHYTAGMHKITLILCLLGLAACDVPLQPPNTPCCDLTDVDFCSASIEVNGFAGKCVCEVTPGDPPWVCTTAFSQN